MIKTPPTASVLGLGNWGTALANHLALKGINVLGWSRLNHEVEEINKNRRNPSCLSECELSFKATSLIEDALKAEFIIIALPSSVLHIYAQKLADAKHATIISAIKGFDPITSLTPLQLLASLGLNETRLCVLSGPSFANDVVRKKPCGLVAGCISIQAAESVSELFACEWMRVYPSNDPLGVELGGAVKNVIALAAGVCDGLDFGESARAGLITRGLAEMMRLADKMGANRETLSGLSGLGDLAMTASSTTSRNYMVGFRLGKGEELPKILTALGSVAEGISSTPIVLSLSKQYGVDMPITAGVSKLVNGELSAAEMAKSLMSRPRRKEF